MIRGVVALAAAAAIAGLVAACSPQPVATDFNRASLMPEPAAKSIIAKTIPSYSGGNELVLSDFRQPIRALTEMMLYRDGKLTIQSRSETTAICDVPLDTARQLAEAFAALGASIQLQRTEDINPWIGCRLTLGR